MKTAIVNIGTILSGDWLDPYVNGDAILMHGGRIVEAGSVASASMTTAPPRFPG